MFSSLERIARMIVGTIPDEIVCAITTRQQHADLAFHLAKDGLHLRFQRGGITGGHGRSSLGVSERVKHDCLRTDDSLK